MHQQRKGMRGVIISSVIISIMGVLLLLISCGTDPEVLENRGVGDEGIGDSEPGDSEPISANVPNALNDPQQTEIRASTFEPKIACGDTLCEGTENECTCPADCGACGNKATERCERYECTPLDACVRVQEQTCCGDAVCSTGESCDSCMTDCCTSTRTLGDFPAKFERLTIIVGNDAPAQNIVTAANLAGALKQMGVTVGETKLDGEVQELRARDYLIIGSPCDNTAAAAALGIDAKHKNQCAVFPRGQGSIRLIPTSSSTVALLVSGGSPYDVERAAKRLVRYQEQPLKSMEVTV